MAEGKKSFVLYCDWKKYTDNLTNEQAGIWIKWAIDYCNDLNPDLPQDQAVQMLIILSKDQFKKDLIKYYDRQDRMNKINENKRFQKEQDTISQRNRNEIASDKCNMLNDKCNMLYKEENINIKEENENIYTLTKFLEELQILLGYTITGKNGDVACKLYEEYGYKTAMYEIKKNIDKKSPIGYTYQVLQNQKPQTDENGSEWLDSFKKGMR